MKPAFLPRGMAQNRTRPHRLGMRDVFQGLGIVMVTLGLFWAGGLAWFIDSVVTERPAAPMPHADGIVVLTGGADRVRAGLALLVSGAAPRLLISGAGAGTSISDFIPRHGIDAAAVTAHITLGHEARSTRGNARETAEWVASRRLRSLIVVTADYHMPRAMLELQRHMPSVRLYADPVRPPSMARPLCRPMLRLIAAEFCKYLLVRLRLGGFAAHHLEFHAPPAPRDAAAKVSPS